MKKHSGVVLGTAAIIALSLSVGGCFDDEEDFEDEATETETSAEISVNTAADRLIVYSNNMENWSDGTCAGDGEWSRLFAYIKAQAKSPDILLIQQISNQAQLNTLLAKLTNELPGVYAGVIAVGDPSPWMYCAANSESSPHSCATSSCSYKKKQQTNAVIYRSDRLSQVVSPRRWRADRYQDGGCSNSNQIRVHNVGVLLYDKIAKKNVSAASFHWPTDTSDGDKCVVENSREAVLQMNELGGSLKIMGGDANQHKGTHGWWNDVRASGFRDPRRQAAQPWQVRSHRPRNRGRTWEPGGRFRESRGAVRPSLRGSGSRCRWSILRRCRRSGQGSGPLPRSLWKPPR
jgi:hypothetical protein